MIKNPFSISEISTMMDDGDKCSLIAIILIVVTPILDFVSMYLYVTKSECYSHLEWFFPTLIFLIACAFIYIYRPWFSLNFERTVEEHCNKILQDFYDESKMSFNVSSANDYLDKFNLNSKMKQLIVTCVNEHKEQANKSNNEEIQKQANLKYINEVRFY